MIKIDGNKIKKIRESQGLTQLYLATAVEVTTDTVSRWENKRYPTIKKENGLRLAEALGVELVDILLTEEDQQSSADEDSTDSAPISNKLYSKQFFTIAAILFCIAVFSIGIIHFRNIQPTIQAIRIMPSNTIPSSSFPIVIEVQNSQSSSVSIILKEMLPKGCTVLATSPAAGTPTKQVEVKWLQKIQKTARFSYLVKIDGPIGTDAIFSGNVAISSNSGSIPVSGNNRISLGGYHWADNDGDNQISDQEILTVFDKYSDIENLAIDIDLIERMWLGTSYNWDKTTQLISIKP